MFFLLDWLEDDAVILEDLCFTIINSRYKVKQSYNKYMYVNTENKVHNT